jgi:leucyl aminopeptidase (aminopeptidase T)
VGEVFTSPVLKGTNGVLHVSRVFLDELEYRDLSLTFTDGMVSDYHCANFDDEEENRRYIEENVLYHHPSLPMGEAAIGTNTTAFVMARKYGIESRLPILIAEKTGPHFAVGDTCYSHEEDNKSYNPDGKEIIARDNEVSILRKTEPKKAYFGCHTDVTIPYDELGLLEAVYTDGRKVAIIENGRFVLPGTEELNQAFEAV